MFKDPLLPLEALPVNIVRPPLTPLVLDDPVWIENAPLDEESPKPDVKNTDPPLCVPEEPAVSVMRPPASMFPLPTKALILPAVPDSLFEVITTTKPLEPESEEPLFNVIAPLIPVLPINVFNVNAPLDEEELMPVLTDTDPPSRSWLSPPDTTTRPPVPNAPAPTTALILPLVPLVALPDDKTTVPLRPTLLCPERIERALLLPNVPLFEVSILNDPLDDVEEPEDTDTEPPLLFKLLPDDMTTRPESPRLPLPTTTLMPPATPFPVLVPVESTTDPLLPDELDPVLSDNEPLTPVAPESLVRKVNEPLDVTEL